MSIRCGRRRRRTWSGSLAVVVALALAFLAMSPLALASGRWVAGDLNNHTHLSDGRHTLGEVLRNAFEVNRLHFVATTDHGGRSANDPGGTAFVTPVWRWITLSMYSMPLVNMYRNLYPERAIILGLEWNVPRREHVSVGVVGPENEPFGISTFEYIFDEADKDTSRAGETTPAVWDKTTDPWTLLQPEVSFAKRNTTFDEALQGVQWLQDTYGSQAFAIVNHPSRGLKWKVGDLRAMNDAAPDVVFGMEGMPGRQASLARGNYKDFFKSDGSKGSAADHDPAVTALARTYGGADLMVAQVGGVWDALLGEGREFWIFGNSDFHRFSNTLRDAEGTAVGLEYFDFWPGQYTKNWVYIKGNEVTPERVVDGMRSGRAFCATGDLVRRLELTATDGTPTGKAKMGGTLRTKAGTTVTVTIAMRSPRFNDNGDRVRVHHVDVITGDVTGRIPPELPNGDPNPAYSSTATNPTTKVLRSIPRSGFTTVNGWLVATVRIKVTKDMYVRLRGTNLPANTPNQTDAKGNPLRDELDYVSWQDPRDPSKTIVGNNPDTAYADLWFYSNPVFIDVR